MEFQNILITGGAGFIGRNLAKRLVNEGHSVTILDNLSPQIHGDNATFDSVGAVYTKSIFADINAIANYRESLEDIDVVVHFAAETGTGQSMYEMVRYTDINTTGTARLLEEVLKGGKVKKMIIASSRSIYGEGKYLCMEHGEVYPKSRKESALASGDFHAKCPICVQNVRPLATDEESKLHPGSIYGVTKLSQEQLVISACDAMNIPWVSLRYQNVYGPGQSLKNPYTGILSIFSTLILNSKKINIFEDGMESRDFVYVDDVVEATYTSIIAQEASNQTLNVGTGKMTTVKEVADLLISLYNIPTETHISGSFRLGDIRHNYADLTKIKSKIGYVPKVAFRDGLNQFVNWVKEQEVNIDKYDESLDIMKKKGLFK